jgi:hypothetical protein
MTAVFLSVEEVEEIHASQINLFGGSHGLRARELLESAVAMPKASFGGESLYADIYEMAAAYLFHIVKNHPFISKKLSGIIDLPASLEHQIAEVLVLPLEANSFIEHNRESMKSAFGCMAGDSG